MSDDSSRSELTRALSVFGICVLAFLAGAITTQFETFPYPQLLERPLFAMRSYLVRASRGGSPSTAIQWQPSHHRATGVTRHRPEAAFDGLTLYVSGPTQGAKLIDMHGQTRHRWKLPYRQAFPDPPHLDPVHSSAIRWTAAHLFADGSLLVNYEADGATPYGYGLAKIDRHSDVLWTYPGRTHHDVTVADDGTIYAIDQTLRPQSETPFAGQSGSVPYLLDDQLVRLSPDGRPTKRLSLLDLIADSPYRDILHHWFDRKVVWDRLHLNSVAPVSRAFARHHDFADPDDLLISMRSLDAIGLVDLQAESLEWVTTGPWRAQHDPEPLGNGHILLFDNKGGAGPRGSSRILEYDPADGRIVWQYAGGADTPFQTGWAGEQSLLPNGNVLINEAARGRVFEVTRNGDIVWEFLNPERRTYEGADYVGIIGHGVQRVTPGELTFSP
ncbi:MAG: arylsulfotransferase family protein [Bradymonadaceae bacterium]